MPLLLLWIAGIVLFIATPYHLAATICVVVAAVLTLVLAIVFGSVITLASKFAKF